MPQLPEDTGIPTVEPSGRGYSVEATPESFGAPIARGLGQLGQGLQKASDFYSEIAADNATNNWHDKVTKLLWGDPNDPDTPGYYNLKGQDAMTARPQIMAAMQAAADEQRGTLWGAKSRFQFDQDTRRSRFLIDQQIGEHYERSATEWGVSTNQDKMDLAANSVANNPNDPATLALALTQVREAGVALAQVKGSDASLEVLRGEQNVRLAQFNALIGPNPQAAWDLLTGDGGTVLRSLKDYPTLYNAAREGTANATAATTSDATIAKYRALAGTATHDTTPAPDVKPYVDRVQDPLIRTTLGMISGGEAHTIKDYAGPKGDYRVAGPYQFDVPTWKLATGQDIPAADVGTDRDPRLDVRQSVDAAAALAQKNREYFISQFHHEPTPGDLALMHQQGIGGGTALLRALGPTPNAPAANFVKPAALTENGMPANITVAQAVRHIEDYYTKGRAGPVMASADDPLPLSQSDVMRLHKDEAVEEYRASLENNPVYKGRTDLLDRAVASFETNYTRAIKDENDQYILDAHAVQSAIVTHKISSENDLNALSPAIAQAWLRLHTENPGAVEAMRNWFKANAGGTAKTYGTAFNDMVDRALAPEGDPRRIKDPLQIDRMITQGENSVLTNSGASILHQILDARNSPTGENDAATLRTFLTQAHSLIAPHTKPSLGQYNAREEKNYADFVGQTMQLLAAGRASNVPVATLLKKGGDIDTMLGHMVPSRAALKLARKETVQDPRFNQELAADAFLRSAKTTDDLIAGIRGDPARGIKPGTITPHQASQAVILNATSVGEVKRAYAAKIITYQEASSVLDHLFKYKRSYLGKPFVSDADYDAATAARRNTAVTQ